MLNNTQLRGIHQSCVVFAQSNKRGGNDGWFPGLNPLGQIVPDGEATGHSGAGDVPGARMWMLLSGNFFTPEYLLNPADKDAVEAEVDPATHDLRPVTGQQHSYASLSVRGTDGEKREWSETLNTGAAVIADRGIGTSEENLSSLWTKPGSGIWHGGITRNDNSTGYEERPIATRSRFTQLDENGQIDWDNQGEFFNDQLFNDDPDRDDALLVHDDALTAYSAK